MRWDNRYFALWEMVYQLERTLEELKPYINSATDDIEERCDELLYVLNEYLNEYKKDEQ